MTVSSNAISTSIQDSLASSRVSSTVDDFCQECTLETYTYRIIHVHEHEELEVDNKLHKDDDIAYPERPGAARLRFTLRARLLDIRRPSFKLYAKGNTTESRTDIGSKKLCGFLSDI